MSRWIESENAMFRMLCCGTYHGVIAFDTVKSVINDVPSIDIVRCRECKYRKHRVDFQNDYCIQHSKVLYSTDGYCSWGEREGE